MADQPTDRCNYCEQPIIWARSLRSSTLMPVDAQPSDKGNVLLSRGPGGALLAGVASTTAAAAARAHGQSTYLHHAVHCPHARQWNKPRPGTGRGGRAQRRTTAR